MKLKKILIPVALFAVTATSVSAFTGEQFNKIDVEVTDEQAAALEEAHELRVAGADRDEIKAVLEAAGIDQSLVRDIHQGMHEVRKEHREALRAAVEADDYEAFQAAVGEGQFGQNITSEADFALLVEAHELRASGDTEGAKAIMQDLGFEQPEGPRHGDRPFHGRMHQEGQEAGE